MIPETMNAVLLICNCVPYKLFYSEYVPAPRRSAC